MSDLSLVNKYNKKISIATNKTNELYELQLENNKLKAYAKSLEKTNTKLNESDNTRTIKTLENKVRDLTLQIKELENSKTQKPQTATNTSTLQAENKKLRNEVKALTNDLQTQHKQIEYMTKLLDSTHDDVSKLASVHKTNKKLTQELNTLKTTSIPPEKHAKIEKELKIIKETAAVTNSEVKETLTKMEQHVNKYKNAVAHAHELIGVCVAYEVAHGNKTITDSLLEGRSMLADLV